MTAAATGLAALRVVPLKMLPFDNKNELLLVLDFDEGTTLERTDAAVRDLEAELAKVPEVTDYVSYVGLPARSTSTAWCGTTTCGRCRTTPRCGSTSSARSTATRRATPSRCGCTTA